MRNSDTGETITIKIYKATHVRMRALIERLTHDGWGAVGVDRRDAPTFATIVDAALTKLDEVTDSKRKR